MGSEQVVPEGGAAGKLPLKEQLELFGKRSRNDSYPAKATTNVDHAVQPTYMDNRLTLRIHGEGWATKRRLVELQELLKRGLKFIRIDRQMILERFIHCREAHL